MRTFSYILNILLVIVLIVIVVKMTVLDSDKGNSSGSSTAVNETLETIFNRTSVRSYSSRKVEPEKVELLLRAAMAAPTAVNKQPWAFVVIDDRALLDTLSARLPYAKMLSQANLAIVVCGDLNKALLEVDQAYWVQDCSAATENILLAAQSLGLGAVWTGVFPRDVRINTVRQTLNIPSHLVPLNLIPIGYPSTKNIPKDKWKPSNIHYNSF